MLFLDRHLETNLIITNLFVDYKRLCLFAAMLVYCDIMIYHYTQGLAD